MRSKTCSAASAGLGRPDLISTILEDGGITDKPWAWDPLRDLKMLGMQDLQTGNNSNKEDQREGRHGRHTEGILFVLL